MYNFQLDVRKMALKNYRSKVLLFLMVVVTLVYFQWAEIPTLTQTLSPSLLHSYGPLSLMFRLAKPNNYSTPAELLTTDPDPSQFDEIPNGCLVPPSREPYKLKDPLNQDYTQYEGTLKVLDDLFPRTIERQRFFVEAGAFDGEYLSNTLNLERDRNWTGLLVEPNPLIFEKLKAKNRKAWFVNSCLSTSTKLLNLTLEFSKDSPLASRLRDKDNKHFGEWSSSEAFEKTLTCLPIFSILSAMKVSTVDFFSLDVEGAEMDVLKTIPFEKIYIKVFLIEMWDVKNEQLNLVRFMKGKKYIPEPFPPSDQNFLFLHPKFARERE